MASVQEEAKLPESVPRPSSSLDDAFKSLEQLLHVLQGASPTAADGALAGESFDSDVTPRSDLQHSASAAALMQASSYRFSAPTAVTASGYERQEAAFRTPQSVTSASRQGPRHNTYGDFDELLHSDIGGLVDEASRSGWAPSRDEQEPLSAHQMAWHDESMLTEDLPSSAPGLFWEQEQEQESLELALAAPSSPQAAELEELKALWEHEREGLHRLLELQERELLDLRSRVQSASPSGGREVAVQCDRGCNRSQEESCEEELCRLRALVQAGYEEMTGLKHCHEEELQQMQALLEQREEELADIRTQQKSPVDSPQGHASPISPHLQADLREALHDKEEEALRLSSELQATNWRLQRLQSQHEREWQDCVDFIKHLASSSSAPTLGLTFDLSTAEVLGMGNYGYIITCRSKGSCDRVVVKLQSARWAGVAAKEWAHGSQISGHSHIVSYLEAFMHRDANLEIQSHLKAGFDSGILTKKRPRAFPDCYFCLALEYMDRGTVQHLMDKHPLTPESVGAITRQVASGLAFMHRRKRTHNDIKPENILLREAPGGDCLIAKLADLGLADHSTERSRDQDLFAYTIWCMGLQERFEKCPVDQPARAAAVARFQRAAPEHRQGRQVWEALGQVMSEMWRGNLEMIEVELMRELETLEVALPDRQEAMELESSAKGDLRKRSMIGWQTNRLRSKGGVHHLLSKHADESGCKIADSEPEDGQSAEEEEDGPPMASTWPQ